MMTDDDDMILVSRAEWLRLRRFKERTLAGRRPALRRTRCRRDGRRRCHHNADKRGTRGDCGHCVVTSRSEVV